MDSPRPPQKLRRLLPLLALLATPLPAAAEWPVYMRSCRPGRVPAPAALRAEVSAKGRTSRPLAIDIAHIGLTIPRTFSRHPIGNSEGFEWYVSRRYALKTDLPATQARETLMLLELAHPHLEAIFGQAIAAQRDRRLAFVFASSRVALQRAMIDDHMHVLRLGGITQEGIWSAYQYAGSAYQNRYIVLHEATHLFQHCLSGSTRQFHKFFVEGVADFFSSHVFDPASGRLTINVLDRAPDHNHLAAGLAEWRERGRPSFSVLYNAADTQRGLDVLMTAFLQSTPAWEQQWRIYCNETIRIGRPGVDPKPLSDRLIASLYGAWPSIDDAFTRWMRRSPSFVPLRRGFDQAGETLVSYDPLNGASAAMLLHPPPGDSSAGDNFVRDYPRAPRHGSSGEANAASQPLFACEISHADTSGNGVAGIGVGWRAAPALLATVSNGIWLVLSGELLGSVAQVHRLPRPARHAEKWLSTIEIGLAEGMLKVAAQRGQPPNGVVRLALPLSSTQQQMLLQHPVGVVASRGGLRVTPRYWSDEAKKAAAVRGEAAISTRFAASRALERVYRAAWRLGAEAPASLLIARNLLLAEAGGAASELLAGAVTEEESFWRGLAAAIETSSAAPEKRMEALCDLAGLALDIVLSEDEKGEGRTTAVACLRAPAVGALKGLLTLGVTGPVGTAEGTSRDYAVRLPPQSARDFALRLRSSLPDGGMTVSATLAGEWLGQRLTLQDVTIANPGIPGWHVLGPFPLPRGEYLDVPLPPEDRPVSLSEIFIAADGTRFAWRRVGRPAALSPDAEHLLHFAEIFGRQANRCAAYALARIDAPAAMQAHLSLGAADGIHVWLNGHSVHADLATREWALSNLRVPLRLERGENMLLIKSIHDQGLWLLSARIEDDAGAPLSGIQYR